MTAKEIIAALEQGTRANHADKHRHGNLIELTSPGDVVMTGDLHGSQRNFERIVSFADLDNHPKRHVILHELLHSGSQGGDECHSYCLKAMAAALKARFPDQVHILLGNHAMAQVTRDEVLKNGQPMVRALNLGIASTFGQNTDYVIKALDDFILSLPIAVRTENRIWMSHSLPSLRHIGQFDDDIFDKKLTLHDFRSDPSLHALTWDRSHNERCIELLRRRWDVDFFLIGHQPQQNGYGRPNEHTFILASDHPHGCLLLFDLEKNYAPDDLCDRIRPLAEIA